MASDMKVFPFYVVVDTSSSMAGCIDAMNQELPQLRKAAREDPTVGELARFGMISFSNAAVQEMPLSDLTEIDQIPHLSASGSTSYAAGFDLLREALVHDLDWFKSQGYKTLRPVVFFITDGHPNAGDPWPAARARLIDPGFTYRPHIVAFGFGDVDEDTLKEVATVRAYAAHRNELPSSVLKAITENLTQSIVASSQGAAASSEPTLVMPQTVDGMYEIPLDVV